MYCTFIILKRVHLKKVVLYVQRVRFFVVR